jgi:plasmid replication initiation protein
MDDKKLVVKSNKLNQARYKLTVQEQRLILAMISDIDQGEDLLKIHRISVQEFKSMVGLSGESSYGQLKNLTKRLLSKVLVISEPDGDLQTHWVDHVKYHNDEGFLEFSFSAKLAPYLLALKKEFTRYQLKNVIRLKSAYSIRIYELLKQYQSVGSRFFDLEEFRQILSIPEGKLSRYTDLRRRVLETAKKELKHSDIGFEYQPIKTGRKVTGLDFTIFQNQDTIKKSYKKRETKKNEKTKSKIIKETQPDLDFERAKAQADIRRLNSLYDHNPDLYQDLEKQAKKRLSKADKKKPGVKTTIRFKMASLLPGFIQKHKIKGI